MSDHPPVADPRALSDQPITPAPDAPPINPQSDPQSDTDQPDTPAQDDPKPAGDDDGPLERRLARLRARLSQSERQRQDLEQQITRARQPADPANPELDRLAGERAEALYQQRVTADREAAFHTAGKAAFRDWGERCNSLIEMGADPQFAQMLIELPDGAQLAGALAEDPEELERILALRSERSKAVALGKYSASLSNRTTAAPGVSRAPPPIRPVNGGTRNGFNEYTATADQLTEYYSNLERKRRGL